MGLMWALANESRVPEAIRSEDPVLFMEPKRIYRAFREEVPDEPYTVPIIAPETEDGVTAGAAVNPVPRPTALQ